MEFEELNVPEDFIYDIASVPGSSDEVCQKAINHYKEQKAKPGLDSRLVEICEGFIGALTEYYNMANLGSENLRGILPHISEVARFMEAQTTVDMDVESTGRIKSFYSEYVKTLDKITECVEKNRPIPKTGFLGDTWATRDILHPRHDMRFNSQQFYKETYSLILSFMEHIDELSQEDPNYGLKEYDEKVLLNLERPKKYTFPSDQTITIPNHSFLEYAFEEKKLQEGFMYLPDLDDDMSITELKDLIKSLREHSKADFIVDKTPLVRKILNQAKIDQLVNYRNEFEAKMIEEIDEKKALSSYESLPFNEFFEEHKRSFSSAQRDKLKFLNFLNEKIKAKDGNSLGNDKVQMPIFENETSEANLKAELFKLATAQDKMIDDRIAAIKALEIDDKFEENYREAQKLKRFSKCCKDYMRNPKKSGYQSFHIIVQTPYGPYEKQIRTEAQDIFAELGPASHTHSYKPDVKSTFHRLKVTTPFSPKRDKSGDIIIPVELGLLPFELAVYNYYKQPFTNFSGGKTLAQFKEEHPEKEDFDRAMLALSPIKVSQNLIQKAWNKLFHKEKKDYIPKIVQTKPTLTDTIYSDVPRDISAYPYMPNAYQKPVFPGIIVQGPPEAPSTDDLDPHDDR